MINGHVEQRFAMVDRVSATIGSCPPDDIRLLRDFSLQKNNGVKDKVDGEWYRIITYLAWRTP